MRILLCTIDFHGYVDSYAAALTRPGWRVQTYLGLRRYHFPTRVRRIAQVSIPSRFGHPRDREWSERLRFRSYLREQDLKSTLLLFVNGQQLVTTELLDYVRAKGGISGLWLLDGAHVLPTPDLDLSEFDLVASFDPVDAGTLRSRSGAPCAYVPQGFDDTVVLGARPYDPSILFIGAPSTRRQEVVQQLMSEDLDLELVGRYWPSVVHRNQHVRLVPKDVGRVSGLQMYVNARPCLNVHSSATAGVNPRTFEVTGAGGLLLTDNATIEEFFAPGNEVLLWSEPDEAVEYARRIAANPEWARQIAARGHARAVAEHSLAKRFERLLHLWGFAMP